MRERLTEKYATMGPLMKAKVRFNVSSQPQKIKLEGKVSGGRSPKPERKGWTTAFTPAGREEWAIVPGTCGLPRSLSTSVSQGTHRDSSSGFSR